MKPFHPWRGKLPKRPPPNSLPTSFGDPQMTATANTLRDLAIRAAAFVLLTMASTAVLALPYLG